MISSRGNLARHWDKVGQRSNLMGKYWENCPEVFGISSLGWLSFWLTSLRLNLRCRFSVVERGVNIGCQQIWATSPTRNGGFHSD